MPLLQAPACFFPWRTLLQEQRPAPQEPCSRSGNQVALPCSTASQPLCTGRRAAFTLHLCVLSAHYSGTGEQDYAGALTSYMRLSGRPGTSGMTTAAVEVSGICCSVCAIALEAPAMTHARAKNSLPARMMTPLGMQDGHVISTTHHEGQHGIQTSPKQQIRWHFLEHILPRGRSFRPLQATESMQGFKSSVQQTGKIEPWRVGGEHTPNVESQSLILLAVLCCVAVAIL